MPSPADVAVIVCTRDRAEFLDQALASIRAETPREVEIVVVDSASRTDETVEVARRHGVRCVRVNRGGLSIARNAGLRAVERPIVIFTDDDCLAMPGWTAHITAHFADGDVDAVGGRMLDHAPAETPPAEGWQTREALTAMDAGHGALMAFRRQVPLLLGGFDEMLGAGRSFAGAEDLDMFFRVARSGGVVVNDPFSAVQHVHVREGGAYGALLRGYGRGVGAFLAKWLRIDARLGRAATWRTLRRALARLARALGNPRIRSGEWEFIRGTLAGLREGWRAPLSGETFTDLTAYPSLLSPAIATRSEAGVLRVQEETA